MWALGCAPGGERTPKCFVRAGKSLVGAGLQPRPLGWELRDATDKTWGRLRVRKAVFSRKRLEVEQLGRYLELRGTGHEEFGADETRACESRFPLLSLSLGDRLGSGEGPEADPVAPSETRRPDLAPRRAAGAGEPFEARERETFEGSSSTPPRRVSAGATARSVSAPLAASGRAVALGSGSVPPPPVEALNGCFPSGCWCLLALVRCLFVCFLRESCSGRFCSCVNAEFGSGAGGDFQWRRWRGLGRLRSVGEEPSAAVGRRWTRRTPNAAGGFGAVSYSARRPDGLSRPPHAQNAGDALRNASIAPFLAFSKVSSGNASQLGRAFRWSSQRVG